MRNNIVQFNREKLKRDQVENDLAMEIARLFRSSEAGKVEDEK